MVEMSVHCVVTSAGRSFSSSYPAAGLLRRLLPAPCSITRRNMSSKRQMDHLERTATNQRQSTVYPAQVCGIVKESESVKRLRLTAHPDFNFKAGQWVDFFIPGVDKVGGFSMCSSPGLLQREGVVELAVKFANHPPAHWVHTALPSDGEDEKTVVRDVFGDTVGSFDPCTLGSQVAVRVGGDFYFDPSPSDPAVDLLLIAGGVGINPLYSILSHTADLLQVNRASGGRGYNIGSVHLRYSAKTTEELLFKNPILRACREFPDKLTCQFHVTQQSTDIEPHLQPFVIRRRIAEEELRTHVDPQRTLCYLCGPPPMIEAISQTLVNLGLPQDRILFEKWW